MISTLITNITKSALQPVEWLINTGASMPSYVLNDSINKAMLIQDHLLDSHKWIEFEFFSNGGWHCWFMCSSFVLNKQIKTCLLLYLLFSTVKMINCGANLLNVTVIGQRNLVCLLSFIWSEILQ